MINRRGIELRQYSIVRYWPTWLLWLTLKLTHRLPLRIQLALGRCGGSILYFLMRRERNTAARNIELCFPKLEASERTKLVRDHFKSIGMSFAEMGLAWFAPIERLRKLVTVHGAENLEQAIANQRPVLLWGAHFTCFEIGVALLADVAPRCATMYRTQNNEMMDTMIRWGRARFAEAQIPRDDIRGMLRCLKEKFVFVYFPDQTWIGNQSAILPFFGEPASTNIATSKLAQMTNAVVLTYFFRRLPDGKGYRVDIGKPLSGLPSDDPKSDSLRLFEELENYIRVAPDQYLWIYKKFKRRPEGFKDPYIT